MKRERYHSNWPLNVQDAKTKELTTGVNLFCYCRGSVGFGEEALQSLPGNVGHQVYICVPLLVLLNFWAWWLLEVLEFTNPRFLGECHVIVVYWIVRLHYQFLSFLSMWQDVADVLAALDEVIQSGLADPAKIAVLGGSHGGFLASHLIGQVNDFFQFYTNHVFSTS